jgi:sulfate transport system permease protein
LGAFFQTITDPRVVASFQVSFGLSFLAALLNGVFGVIAAWVLTRYRFPGRRILDAMVDLPFALPTAVAGIALTAIYAPNEWIGGLLEPYGIRVAFTRLGIFIALTFIGFPFVVRTVQPVICSSPSSWKRPPPASGPTAGRPSVASFFPPCCPRSSPV